MKHILFIINPRSGTLTKKDLPGLIKKNFPNSVWQTEIVFTQYRGHATTIAEEAMKMNYDSIVVAGGDGTVNETAKVLINNPTHQTSLGILPLGSGNGLARHLKIPMNIHSAIKVVLNNKVSSIDCGLVNNHPFFIAAGTGFDSHISKLFLNLKTRGFINYFRLGVQTYLSYKSHSYNIEFEQNQINRNALFLTFANASQFGNNAFIAPHAKINDGKLELCLVKKHSFFKAFLDCFYLFTKKIQQSEGYETYSIEKAVLKNNSTICFQLDGEPMEFTGDICIKAKYRCLRVITGNDFIG